MCGMSYPGFGGSQVQEHPRLRQANMEEWRSRSVSVVRADGSPLCSGVTKGWARRENLAERAH